MIDKGQRSSSGASSELRQVRRVDLIDVAGVS